MNRFDRFLGVLCAVMTAISIGLAVGCILKDDAAFHWPALSSYLQANVFSILTGYFLKKSPDYEKLNNRYQRFSVVALNGVAGVAVLWICLKHPYQYVRPALALGIFFSLYLATYVTGLIKPNSFLARFRSVITRMVLTTVIAGMMMPLGYAVITIVSIPVLIVSWKHLKRDMQLYGWAFR